MDDLSRLDKPAGGIRTQYQGVDALNDAGLSAAIVHKRPGFACSWFAHRTRIVAASEVVLGERDVIVVPEVYGPAILDLPTGVRQVIFNQNPISDARLTDDGTSGGGPLSGQPRPRRRGRRLGRQRPAARARISGHADPAYPPRNRSRDPLSTRRGGTRRITYMPRRRVDEAKQVLRLLELRGLLYGWEIVAIDGRSEAEAADLLRAAASSSASASEKGSAYLPARPWRAAV